MADFLRLHPGPALEIGCGSGRLTLPLLENGFDLDGLELSTDMLDLFRQHAAPLTPTLFTGDMSTWHPPAPYAALLAPAFTLQLAADPAATLRHWHQWLRPGGGLYLTLFVPFAEINGDHPPDRWYRDHQSRLPDGRCARLDTRHQIDPTHRILHREHRYRIDGNPPRQYRSAQTIRWFDPAEIPNLLASTGFEITAAFPDFDPTRPLPADPSRQTEDFDGIFTYLATRTQIQA
jgi:SAM-dependent methyltransferase